MTALDRLADAMCDECDPEIRDAQLDLVIDILAQRVTVRECWRCAGPLDHDLYCAACGATTTTNDRAATPHLSGQRVAAQKETP